MSSDKEIDAYVKRLEDRFGKMPGELENLFCVLKLRNLGASLGFEKIIVKNGIMISFFVSNPMSSYYKSAVFERVLIKVGEFPLSTEIKQVENKLKMVSRNVSSLQDALSLIRKLR